ncbi:hypothetical protein ABW20_dc0100324 [Dactylellina cionopaga]|nr:hypothetical protein ABW20_dc0100324 [Dactylellina cionopaga]
MIPNPRFRPSRKVDIDCLAIHCVIWSNLEQTLTYTITLAGYDQRQCATAVMAESRSRSSSLPSLDATEFKFPQDLVPLRENLQPGRVTTTTLDGTLTKTPLQLIEDLTNGCGGQLWPAGVRLAKYFINKYRDNNGLAGKRIIELGSGGGVTGLAIGLELDQIGGDVEKGGCEFWMTDMQAMMELMEKNVAFNQLQGKISCGLLDWADPLPEFVTKEPVDIVLAADCVYFEPAFPLLEKTL